MNFDHEELTLMMLYNTGTRLGLIQELRLMQCYQSSGKFSRHRIKKCHLEQSGLAQDDISYLHRRKRHRLFFPCMED